MQEYSLTRGGKILVLVLLIPMLAMSILGCIAPFFVDERDRSFVFLAIASPLCVIFFLYWLFRVNEKFIVDGYSIRHQARFIKRELPLRDIRGYRMDDHYLHLVPFPGKGKKIKISSWVGNFGDLHDWAALRFPDLEQQEVESYELPALNNENSTADKRRKQARIEVYALDCIAFILLLSFFLLDADPLWASILLILCLLASILMLRRYKGIVQLEELRKSPHPSMYLPAVVSCAALYLGARDIHVLEYASIWVPAIVTTAILAGLLYYSGSHIEWKKPMTAISAALLLLLFFGGSVGIVLQFNRITGKGTPQYYEAQVSNKRVSKGKGTSYYLELRPWGPQTTTKEISVPFDVYDNVNVNERVAVHLYTGGLGIPWYAVSLP